MRPLKAETDALAAVMMTPLADFLTDKEAETHKDPEGLAQKRMFAKAVEAVDEARGTRTMWMVVLRFGTVPSSVIYQGFGPYATQKQASDATESILRATEATAYAVVPMRTHGGWEAMVASADEPSADKGQWAEVRKDAAAKRRGWRGKARERDGYLTPA